MIDLHMHSDVSDGSLSPEALAAQVAQCGLTAAALTDHDTTAGADRFTEACGKLGVRGIAGVEISADFSPGTMHVLGYFPAVPGGDFERQLGRIREGRTERNARILETLKALGMPIDQQALDELSGDGVAGRPHIAQAMTERGYVPDGRAAFDLYLAKGKPAYHDRFRLGPQEAVAAICSAGGAAVLAHPFTLKLTTEALRGMLEALSEAGLSGVEVIYPEHPEPLRQLYTTLALERGLAVVGGSDFHGALNPAIQLGRGFGNVRVPEKALEDLETRSGLCFGSRGDGGATGAAR
jgi:predicted metal-dependent phosphoesterase TrpH